eukprot:ctg_2499.g596
MGKPRPRPHSRLAFAPPSTRGLERPIGDRVRPPILLDGSFSAFRGTRFRATPQPQACGTGPNSAEHGALAAGSGAAMGTESGAEVSTLAAAAGRGRAEAEPEGATVGSDAAGSPGLFADEATDSVDAPVTNGGSASGPQVKEAPTEAVRAAAVAKPSGARGGTAANGASMGWLLRLFRSDFFDAWMAVTYLYRYRKTRGVLEYLCNELYNLNLDELELYLPQLCNILVFHARDSTALEKFIMDKCAESMHFALEVYWFLQAALEDSRSKEMLKRCDLLRTRCETAAVNGYSDTLLMSSPTALADLMGYDFVQLSVSDSGELQVLADVTDGDSPRGAGAARSPTEGRRERPAVDATVTDADVTAQNRLPRGVGARSGADIRHAVAAHGRDAVFGHDVDDAIRRPGLQADGRAGGAPLPARRLALHPPAALALQRDGAAGAARGVRREHHPVQQGASADSGVRRGAGDHHDLPGSERVLPAPGQRRPAARDGARAAARAAGDSGRLAAGRFRAGGGGAAGGAGCCRGARPGGADGIAVQAARSSYGNTQSVGDAFAPTTAVRPPGVGRQCAPRHPVVFGAVGRAASSTSAVALLEFRCAAPTSSARRARDESPDGERRRRTAALAIDAQSHRGGRARDTARRVGHTRATVADRDAPRSAHHSTTAGERGGARQAQRSGRVASAAGDARRRGAGVVGGGGVLASASARSPRRQLSRGGARRRRGGRHLAGHPAQCVARARGHPAGGLRRDVGVERGARAPCLAVRPPAHLAAGVVHRQSRRRSATGAAGGAAGGPNAAHLRGGVPAAVAAAVHHRVRQPRCRPGGDHPRRGQRALAEEAHARLCVAARLFRTGVRRAVQRHLLQSAAQLCGEHGRILAGHLPAAGARPPQRQHHVGGERPRGAHRFRLHAGQLARLHPLRGGAVQTVARVSASDGRRALRGVPLLSRAGGERFPGLPQTPREDHHPHRGDDRGHPHALHDRRHVGGGVATQSVHVVAHRARVHSRHVESGG